MTPKNRTLEGKNRTLGGEGGSKIVENRRTSFMYVPLRYIKKDPPKNLYVLIHVWQTSFSSLASSFKLK